MTETSNTQSPTIEQFLAEHVEQPCDDQQVHALTEHVRTIRWIVEGWEDRARQAERRGRGKGSSVVARRARAERRLLSDCAAEIRTVIDNG